MRGTRSPSPRPPQHPVKLRYALGRDPPRDGEATHHSQGPCRGVEKGSREDGSQGRGGGEGDAHRRGPALGLAQTLTVLGADRLPSAAVPEHGQRTLHPGGGAHVEFPSHRRQPASHGPRVSVGSDARLWQPVSWNLIRDEGCSLEPWPLFITSPA